MDSVQRLQPWLTRLRELFLKSNVIVIYKSIHIHPFFHTYTHTNKNSYTIRVASYTYVIHPMILAFSIRYHSYTTVIIMRSATVKNTLYLRKQFKGLTFLITNKIIWYCNIATLNCSDLKPAYMIATRGSLQPPWLWELLCEISFHRYCWASLNLARKMYSFLPICCCVYR